MILPNDLRIGNYVMLDGELYQIRAGEQIDDFSDRMKGIQIDALWLEKFGYTKSSDDCFYKSGSTLPPIYWIYQGKWGMRGLPMNGHNYQYVHQLQNLYYILSGEELIQK